MSDEVISIISLYLNKPSDFIIKSITYFLISSPICFVFSKTSRILLVSLYDASRRLIRKNSMDQMLMDI